MAELVDVSDICNLQTGGGAVGPQSPFFFKLGRIAGAAAPATIAGRPASLWRYDGQPAGAPIPTTVEAPTNASVGALPFTSPTGGRQAWQLQGWATGLVPGTLVLYDRLLHIGGLNGTVTTAQTVGGTLTRNTGGVGNMMWAEIYTNIGATARTLTASYTNQAGTSGRTSIATPIGATGFLEATRVLLMPLASGDTGVQAVASVTLSATTGTAGNFGVTVAKPLAYIGVGGAGAPGWRDFITGLPGIPELPVGCCPALLWFPSTTTAPEIFGGINSVEK
jgi:hypothetical protein